MIFCMCFNKYGPFVEDRVYENQTNYSIPSFILNNTIIHFIIIKILSGKQYVINIQG